MRGLGLIILLTSLVFSCREKGETRKPETISVLVDSTKAKNQANPSSTKSPKSTLPDSLTSTSIKDTVFKYYIQSLSKDSLDYSRYYDLPKCCHLFMIKKGRLFSSSKSHTLIIYTEDIVGSVEDIVLVKLELYDDAGFLAYTQAEIYGFSPAYFHEVTADYNFDGYDDFYLNFYHTMGIVEGYGYIVLYDPLVERLNVVYESIHVPNLEASPERQEIISVTYPREEFEKVKETFQWDGDSLIKVSEKKWKRK
jgi:hypothetical protein